MACALYLWLSLKLSTMFKTTKWSVVLEKLNFITQQNFKIMSDLTDLQASVAQLKADAVASKTSLDNISANVTKIAAGLPATGGLSEADVATLKANLADAIVSANATAAEAAQVDTALGAVANPPAPAPAPAS